MVFVRVLGRVFVRLRMRRDTAGVDDMFIISALVSRQPGLFACARGLTLDPDICCDIHNMCLPGTHTIWRRPAHVGC